MKKVLFFAAIAALTFGVVACKPKKVEEPEVDVEIVEFDEDEDFEEIEEIAENVDQPATAVKKTTTTAPKKAEPQQEQPATKVEEQPKAEEPAAPVNPRVQQTTETEGEKVNPRAR